MNFARRTECNRCNTPRPDETYEDYKPGKKDQNSNGFQNNNTFEEGEMIEDGEYQQEGNFGDNEVEEGEVGAWQ